MLESFALASLADFGEIVRGKIPPCKKITSLGQRDRASPSNSIQIPEIRGKLTGSARPAKRVHDNGSALVVFLFGERLMDSGVIAHSSSL